ncbi:hypothetical protein F4V91_13575 [Neorhizobium galegae]|uniref:Phage tail protein n=1 Tax=Neorhizobium galegae TaxID=399 RepID=A0A6A1TS01_NEOGA|nr:tail protein X [Neorhizobium galegae]KAB1087362.1 hypothetical protein F4V91_13575 [Neorhizobium galegae]
MTIYTVAYGGERLDRIARKTLQTEQQGAVDTILQANPGLAAVAFSGVVEADTAIQIPEDFAPAPTETFTLAWE